jgi:hypothetical protein
MRRLHLVAATIIATAGLGAVGLASAPKASAAPCYGLSCAGYDPSTTGCNQYYSTSKQAGGTWATVVNWYSTGCNANWAQAWLSSAAIARGYTMRVEITTMDSNKPSQHELMCYPSNLSNSGQKTEYCPPGDFYSGTGPAYTDMVDGTNVTTATVYVFDALGVGMIAQYSIPQ